MRLTWANTEEDLDEIRTVESTQDWRSIVEGRQVRPRWDLRRDLLGSVEHDSAGQSECQITQNGGKTLELWIPVVQDASAEWRSILGKLVWVCSNQLPDLGDTGVDEEDVGEVFTKLFLGPEEIGLEKCEQRSLIFLGAEDVWHAGVLSRLQEQIWRLSEDCSIRTW